MKHVEDVNQQHLCGDKALHLKIVDGFGQANLVAKAIPAPVTPKKKPGKAQTGWIDGGVGE